MDGKLTVGEILNGVVATLQDNLRPIGMYMASYAVLMLVMYGLAAASGLSMPSIEGDWRLAIWSLGSAAAIIAIAVIAIAVILQYLLWEAMLRDMGAQIEERRRVLALLGQSILIGLGTGLGFLLLIVPGLMCMARWSMAPALLVGERQGIVEAMGNSWETVRGNTTPVILAIIAGGLIYLAAYFVIVAIIGWLGESGGGLLIGFASYLTELVGQFGTILGIALGVFLYRRLYGVHSEVAEVFS